MHKVTFFPLGNADCCRIDLLDGKGKKILFDYADSRDPEDKDDLRIDLATTLKDDLDSVGRDYYDIVAFTHADDDHIHGFSEFFRLDHAEKYQDKGRIKIGEMWVPAAVIIEKGLKDEAIILQAEARHRLINGRGIRIFSRPDRLKEWLEEHKIKPEDRRGLITDAGQVVPGLTKQNDGIEFFVHSPFAVRQDGMLIDRNEAALVMQATISDGGRDIRMILGSDCEHEAWCDIVRITRYHKREERLAWDIFKISHHCSYTALSAEKGEDKTKPDDEVEWLFGRGVPRGVLVATCKPIPTDDADNQPPHRQAANYYKGMAGSTAGEFIVTMEHPSKFRPEPLEIKIDGFGATPRKAIFGGGVSVASRPVRSGSGCRA